MTCQAFLTPLSSPPPCASSTTSLLQLFLFALFFFPPLASLDLSVSFSRLSSPLNFSSSHYIYFILLLRSFVPLLSEYSQHAFISYASIFSFVSYFFPSPVSLRDLSSGFSRLSIIILLSAKAIHPLIPASSLALPSPPSLLLTLGSRPSLCLALWLSPLPDARLKLRFVAYS